MSLAECRSCELVCAALSLSSVATTQPFNGLTVHINVKQIGQLLQPNRAVACISFGKNISAKSLHLTLPYATVLISTNDHITVCKNAKLCSI